VSARSKTEDAIVACLENARAALGFDQSVKFFQGLRTGERPDEYIVAIADEEESKSPNGGVYMVAVRLVSVVTLDRDGAVERSKKRIDALLGWLGDPTCPLRSYASAVLEVKGVVIEGSESEIRERRQGEIIHMRVAVLV
jgi:hypothetical protein